MWPLKAVSHQGEDPFVSDQAQLTQFKILLLHNLQDWMFIQR